MRTTLADLLDRVAILLWEVAHRLRPVEVGRARDPEDVEVWEGER